VSGRGRGSRWAVVVVAVAGVVVFGGVGLMVRDAARPGPSVSAESVVPGGAATSAGPAAAGGAGCRLPAPGPGGEVEPGNGPAVDGWRFTGAAAGTSGYPVSGVFGPAETSGEGVRRCFQQSVAGALFAASSFTAQQAEAPSLPYWAGGALIGPGSAATLDELGRAVASPTSTVEPAPFRMSLSGFKILQVERGAGGLPSRVLVDLGVTMSAQGDEFLWSFVWDLRWEGGDWRVWVEAPGGLSQGFANTVRLSRFAGYTPWSPPR